LFFFACDETGLFCSLNVEVEAVSFLITHFSETIEEREFSHFGWNRMALRPSARTDTSPGLRQFSDLSGWYVESGVGAILARARLPKMRNQLIKDISWCQVGTKSANPCGNLIVGSRIISRAKVSNSKMRSLTNYTNKDFDFFV